jgi:arsenate reductase (thioredoxin)
LSTESPRRRAEFQRFQRGDASSKRARFVSAEILRLARYPTDGLHPKSWQDFARADAPPLDFVFTLCDPDAGAPVPHWPGRPVTADWRYADPVRLKCEDWERRKELGAMLAGLERQLRAFIQLPFRSLDDISLRGRLRELGQGVEAS